MTIKKILLSFCFCVLASFSMQALSLLVSDATGDKGQTVNVSIKITGFDAVVGMQFSINWDSTVLAFKSIENLSEQLPQFTNNEIGLLGTSSGALRVAWIDNSTNGITVPDTFLLFNLKFEIIGEPGTTSGVSISNNPIGIEFSDPDGNILELEELLDGKVVIPGNPTALVDLEASKGVELYQNEPNPFYSTTKITVSFARTEQILFFITDAIGKVVHHKIIKPIQGKNIIEIERKMLNAPGIYYYTLQSEHYQLSKKLILLP